MLPAPFANALVLTGPTGSGKTRLGLELAQRLDAEIVSMDSMAFYRGMDIGTAKPTPQERSQVRHHLINVLDPWESASVAWWLDQAKRCCQDIERRGKQVLFVGGTPLYLKAMTSGLFVGPPADSALRKRLEDEALLHGGAALHQRLARIDPISAGRLHPNDLRRIIRALEVFEITKKPISAWQTQWPIMGNLEEPAALMTGTDPWPLTPILWLDLPRAELYARINGRVQAMFAAGLIEEVAQLQALGRPLGKEAAQALGYKEVLGYLEGRQDLEATIAAVQLRTRNYAKRQITWFRHLPYCRPATSQLTWDLWQPKMK
jgi:tRNA dimethylallyltransferase